MVPPLLEVFRALASLQVQAKESHLAVVVLAHRPLLLLHLLLHPSVEEAISAPFRLNFLLRKLERARANPLLQVVLVRDRIIAAKMEASTVVNMEVRTVAKMVPRVGSMVEVHLMVRVARVKARSPLLEAAVV